jgi:hypothetical protein
VAHKCKLKRAAWQKIDLAANKILIKESKGAKDQRYAFQGSENQAAIDTQKISSLAFFFKYSLRTITISYEGAGLVYTFLKKGLSRILHTVLNNQKMTLFETDKNQIEIGNREKSVHLLKIINSIWNEL